MSARAIQGQNAIASEMFVQPVLPSDAVIPAGVREANMIAAIDVRPDGILDNAERKEKLHAKGHSANEDVRIAIKAKGRVIFVDSAEIIAAKAEGNYLALLHKSGCYLVRETMANAEQKLAPLGFVRIHRSILVNATLVKDLRRNSSGTYLLRTTDGREHPVGRTYKDNLNVIANSWLGVSTWC
jgi:DNA-binding LytR/AlgR family response regulator